MYNLGAWVGGSSMSRGGEERTRQQTRGVDLDMALRQLEPPLCVMIRFWHRFRKE